MPARSRISPATTYFWINSWCATSLRWGATRTTPGGNGTPSSADDTAVAHALQAVHLHAFADRRFDTLSSGERQRVWIAMALAQEAPLLLLDEPTSHLDVRVAREILHLLRAQVQTGKTVICALHDLNEAAEFADRLLLLGCAELLAFAPPAQTLTPELLERAYGIRMDVVRSGSGTLRVFPASSDPLPAAANRLTTNLANRVTQFVRTTCRRGISDIFAPPRMGASKLCFRKNADKQKRHRTCRFERSRTACRAHEHYQGSRASGIPLPRRSDEAHLPVAAAKLAGENHHADCVVRIMLNFWCTMPVMHDRTTALVPGRVSIACGSKKRRVSVDPAP